MAQGSTPESASSARPFKYHGNQGEFTLLAPLKPGGAERTREIQRGAEERFTAISDALHGIGTLHNVRIALVDNDTRMLFAAIYDGTWDQYIDDFATAAAAGRLRFLDELWENLEGYPGLASPDVKDYLVKYQAPVGFLWTAQPDSTVRSKPESRACARRRRAGAGRCWLILAVHWGRRVPCSRAGNPEGRQPLLIGTLRYLGVREPHFAGLVLPARESPSAAGI